MSVLLREAIGDGIRRARTARNRTLRDVSHSARVSLGYLSEIERGRKEPSSELLAAICEALALPLPDLLDGVADSMRPAIPRRPVAVLDPALRTAVEEALEDALDAEHAGTAEASDADADDVGPAPETGGGAGSGDDEAPGADAAVDEAAGDLPAEDEPDDEGEPAVGDVPQSPVGAPMVLLGRVAMGPPAVRVAA